MGSLAPVGAFMVTLYAFSQLTPENSSFRQHFFDWMKVEGGFEANFTLLFDKLSAVMCLVITGVGSLIHLYSTGYMKGDAGFTRYFAYLNLFTAFMLILVLGDNLLLLFVGWEGVGLCSYLLIGFWHTDHANSSAGQKAFIVNRVGDFAFIIPHHRDLLSAALLPEVSGAPKKLRKIVERCGGRSHSAGAALGSGASVSPKTASRGST